MAQVQGPSINDAWTKAIASYRRDLNPKQLQTVQTLTSPEDIVKHMEQLEKDRMSSQSGKLMHRVKSVTDRLVRFSKVVDVMTTSNAEASLMWGSLKLLLTIVHQSTEEYERICQSLLTVGESLQVVELLANTFRHSPLVSECVVNYYCSILHFWRKAIKHYRRRKFFQFIRGAWHNYDSEFGDFEAKMMRLREETQKAAVVVHMSEASKARQQQDKFNTEFNDKSRTTEELTRHREIVRWLTPPTRDAKYYVDDFESACRDRHLGTCEWILRKPEFQQWIGSEGTDPQRRMLWVSAIAGAGKTVLAASIIAHCRARINSSTKRPILYFFFKNTDDEKDSLLSMTRSFLHQLYSSFGTDDFNHDLASLKEGSGKDTMLSDERAWDMFMKYGRKLPGMTIVLDALDECKLGDIDELLNRLCLLARTLEVRVIVTSRREEMIRDKLDSWPCIPIQQQDVDADIKSFVVAKIDNIPRLNSGLLRDRIVRTLSARHEGMFLWVFLMIKELKSLATVKEVEERLSAAPKGLKQMHQAIITRLSTTLSSSEQFIALKVLSWVVSAIRPLYLVEIHEVLRFEIKRVSTDDDLLYSEKDIELVCGSLVTTRNGVLQLIHLSTKEILQERPGGMSPDDPCWPFYVDVRETGPRIALLCTSYIDTHQCHVDSYVQPELSLTSRLEHRSSKFDLPRILEAAPFLEYAYTSWQGHLVDGEAEEGLLLQLQSILSYRFTSLWVEFRLAQDPDALWKLERNCIAMQDWVLRSSMTSEGVAFLQAWCGAMLGLFKEYGLIIRAWPQEMHYIDIGSFFSSPHPGEFYPKLGEPNLREHERYLADLGSRKSKSEIEPYRQLLPQLEGHGFLGFFLYDEKRDVFCYSEKEFRSGMETIWVQDRQTGRRLSPMKKALSFESDMFMNGEPVSAVFSRDRRYLGILYCVDYTSYCTSIWEIEDQFNFHDIKQSQPWARRLQCLHVPDMTEEYLSKYCRSLYLTIGPDDLFCTPSGLVDAHRGVRQRLPAPPLGRDRDIPAFSGDGRFLFYGDWDSRQIYKVCWLKPTPTTEILPLPELASLPALDSWPDEVKVGFISISDNGDYLLFLRREHRLEESGYNQHLYIMNTRTGTVNALSNEDNEYKLAYSFGFRSAVFWNQSLILLQ